MPTLPFNCVTSMCIIQYRPMIQCNNYMQSVRVCLYHRHLKLRTEGSHARVGELGSIRLFNVTSASVVRILPKFVHIIIQVYGTMVANLVIVRFIFTILLNMACCCPVILHVFQALVI